MKKLLTVVGACALALSLSACGSGGASGADSKASEQKVGLISTTENVLMPEQKKEEVKVADADALETKWKDTGKKYAESKGLSSFDVDTTFQNFSGDKIESYKLYLNNNKDWKTGDKAKVDFVCQTVKPATIKVWIVPDLEGVDTDEQKGQLTEVGCGVKTPASASWEYTLSADTNNLLLVHYQVPVEGFMISTVEKQ